jgi:rubrerythrin
MIKTHQCLWVFGLALICSMTLIPGVHAEEAVASSTQATLDNLMTAFNGESNANAKYLAFAEKADQEGYGAVATLFRAAAQAEKIHFTWHSQIIQDLTGTVPVANIETPAVRSTAENLQAAIDGETYESTVMYPGFITKAEEEAVTEAIDAFEDASAAEAVHARLYKEALAGLDQKAPAKTLYVCPKCGNVEEVRPGTVCPICGRPAADFIPVN